MREASKNDSPPNKISKLNSEEHFDDSFKEHEINETDIIASLKKQLYEKDKLVKRIMKEAEEKLTKTKEEAEKELTKTKEETEKELKEKDKIIQELQEKNSNKEIQANSIQSLEISFKGLNVNCKFIILINLFYLLLNFF